ncbi:hypothetical protein DLM45_13285 [Hyphomicrobium methylovorum]|nr:hypothetical protein [Hyphomicrobium methylovorum]
MLLHLGEVLADVAYLEHGDRTRTALAKLFGITRQALSLLAQHSETVPRLQVRPELGRRSNRLFERHEKRAA